MEPPPDALQIPLGLDEASKRLPVGCRLPPDDREGPIHTGDRRLDHEHGLANLLKSPFVGGRLKV